MGQSQITTALTHEELRRRIQPIPRVRLAHLPTPFEEAPRLSRALGGPRLWLKRDDCTGLAFGGNKTRQLEFLFAEALAQDADTIVIGAGTQSNLCRQATAAACRLGLEAHLLLVHGIKGPTKQGNLLLDEVMGAHVTIVPGEDLEQLPAWIEEKADDLRRQGRRPAIMNPFGLATQTLAAIGYVEAAIELSEQLDCAGLQADSLYLAGANITQAGLALGVQALGLPTKVVGITPIRWREDRPTDIARIATATAERLTLDLRFEARDIINEDRYVGERYGELTPACEEAITLVARTEGVILDPVYTGKAMAGVIDHIRQGRIAKDETVVFLHTGGTPALFAYAEDLHLNPNPRAARRAAVPFACSRSAPGTPPSHRRPL